MMLKIKKPKRISTNHNYKDVDHIIKDIESAKCDEFMLDEILFESNKAYVEGAITSSEYSRIVSKIADECLKIDYDSLAI